MIEYTITQSRLLYVLAINDRQHQNLLKVGEVFVDNGVVRKPDTLQWSAAVRSVLDKRSYMAGVAYEIQYVECTTYNQGTQCYKADDVYRTLAKNGIPCKRLHKVDRLDAFGKKQRVDADVWHACTLWDVQEAIRLIKDGHGAGYGEIKFRPEQEDAIKKAVAHFQKPAGKGFLWNAKMRFGKTLSGLEVAKRMDYKSTLIITHRPVVDKGWHDDFKKIFGGDKRYVYATRMKDNIKEEEKVEKDVVLLTTDNFQSLTTAVDHGGKRIVAFVSMQYLRLSQVVGGKEKHPDPLKRDIMQYDWDFVMVDEAHEGIEADAGRRVMEKLKKTDTRILSLSGTPFNLLDKYEEGEIYTWDYVMEQQEKVRWDDEHYGDPNPYADLPRMQILTFHLDKMTRDKAVENNEMFRFHEFFRVWTREDIGQLKKQIADEPNAARRAELQEQVAHAEEGHFVYEPDVKAFVKKLRTKSDTSLYPFSTPEFRQNFRHTFWLLPGVKEAAAMERILKEDEIFGATDGKKKFHIINAAGDGNIEDRNGCALAEVEDHIRGNKQKNISAKARTITLSCGKLTTGVSVPEWTAVLCMKGSENTPAANYMQTIFRVQTHAVLNGRQKSDCYVFDFAPDRALTAVAETAKMAVYAQGRKKQLKLSQKKEEEHLEAFIKLCPVLSMDEGEMGRQISAGQIFEKLSNVYIERAVRSGYADNSLYNPDQLLHLTPEQEKALGDVHDLLGSMPNSWKPEKISVNHNGIGNVEGADAVKYIYCLSATPALPPTPRMSAESDENDQPTTDDEGWDDVMNLPTQMFPYLFTSMSRKDKGAWGDFSKPVLWRQWTEPAKDDEKSEAKKKRDEENKEKRARMSVLRGVSIRIPLLVYGAEINDEEGEEITVDNFADDHIVDDASWEEFMPKGFTKQTFRILKECFDRSIFTGAAKRIRQMVKEADRLNTEDRIARIATIFSYFHNPDKETVLTPWRVVNMQLSDTLGGWCFQNEQFDGDNLVENQYGEVVHMPRPVDRGEVTRDVFADPNARILEINSKTGLYPLYMAYSVFKGAKEPAFRRTDLTGERGTSRNAEQYYRQAGDDLEIWKDVLQDNIFVVCRTRMAVSITKRTLAGFRKDVRMNVVCYERTLEIDGERRPCDMITVLRHKPELFRQDVVQGRDFWHVYNSIPKNDNENINNMKFKAIVGNPPYQVNVGKKKDNYGIPLYNQFFDIAKNISPNYISMIMPSRWFTGGRGLEDFRNRMLNDTRIKSICDFVDSKDCFPTVDISGGICYLLWGKDYNGDCLFTNKFHGTSSSNYRKLNEHSIFVRNNSSLSLIDKVKQMSTDMLNTVVSGQTPFGFVTTFRGQNNNFPNAVELKSSGELTYVSREQIRKNAQWIDKYKVIFSKATCEHAGIPDKNGMYRVISYMGILKPNTVCTQSYLVGGAFDKEEEAVNYQAYIKTKFVRSLVLQTITSQDISPDKFAFVPLQDFTSHSDINWGRKISDIDKQLYKKYNLSEDEISFIEKMIKPMD